MGAFRKGIVVTLGMVTMICNIESAVEKEETLKSVCTGAPGHAEHAPTAISRVNKCPECEEIGYADIKKARLVGGQFQVMEQAEVAEVKDDIVGATKKMLGLTLHRTEDVREATLPSDQSTYAVVPADASQRKTYSTLVDTLYRHPELTLLGIWTPTSRPTLYEIKLFGTSLVMEPRARVEDVKVAPVDLIEQSEQQQKVMDTALGTQLMPIEDFDPSKYADTFREKLNALAESKTAVDGVLSERTKTTAKTAAASGGVDVTDDLMAQLAVLGLSVDAEPEAKPKRVRKVA